MAIKSNKVQFKKDVVKSLMKQRDITIGDLATKIGYTDNTMRCVLKRKNITPKYLAKIADVLGASYESLCEHDELFAPIVRCKNCIHYKPHACTLRHEYHLKDWYCADGRKRDG